MSVEVQPHESDLPLQAHWEITWDVRGVLRIIGEIKAYLVGVGLVGALRAVAFILGACTSGSRWAARSESEPDQKMYHVAVQRQNYSLAGALAGAIGGHDEDAISSSGVGKSESLKGRKKRLESTICMGGGS